MWPTPRAPISATRKRVVGVTRQTVSGTPISPFSELTGATVSATEVSTDARRSLTLVLPDEPVTPTTRSSGARSMTPRATRPKAVWTSSTTTHGTPSTGREVRAATAPAATADRDEVVPVGGLADPRDVEAARPAVAGVGGDRAVDDDGLRGVGAVDRRRR